MAKTAPPDATDQRLASLVTLFANNATIAISGSRIAREIGVSRSTVWRWVERLREVGVRVKGKPNTGYFLERVPDVLTPDLLRQQLKGSLFAGRLHHFFRIDSTNRMAMELGQSGGPEGTVVIAEEQTAGRGRAGRNWQSERGSGIYATLLLRPRISPVQASLLTMMAGLSAHAAVRAQTGLVPDLKWPNDLMLAGKKLGGILTEMQADTSLVRFVIVGIGINVNQERFAGDIASSATSLRMEAGKPFSRLEFLARLLREFERDYLAFLRDGGNSVTERFCEVSSYARGKRVRVNNGAETYTGITAGVRPEGLLQVKRDDGELVAVIAGDVSELKP
jgi:BirA family biotin operon repressor/biotin-[acetyl-CoA-carboxylase] ligase